MRKSNMYKGGLLEFSGLVYRSLDYDEPIKNILAKEKAIEFIREETNRLYQVYKGAYGFDLNAEQIELLVATLFNECKKTNGEPYENTPIKLKVYIYGVDSRTYTAKPRDKREYISETKHQLKER